MEDIFKTTVILMRIAITGPQGSGKSTLTAALAKEPELEDYRVINEITREVKKLGLPINEQGNELTQIVINAEHLKNLVHENILTDRCLLDSMIYGMYLDSHSGFAYKETVEHLIYCTNKYINQYDLVVYVPSEFELEDDGVRSTNIEFKEEIEELFDYYITYYRMQGINIIYVSGTVEERVNRIKQAIYEYQSRTSN